MIYFDNNSTTRVLESTVEAMRPFMTERFANPASAIAQFGGVAQTVRAEKARLANALGAESGNQFVTTSGATESNNLAILGAARANPKRRHIIAASIEHPSVLEPCEALREGGYSVSTLPVTKDGVVSSDVLAGALTPDTLLVSVMLANNETGVVQPIAALAETVKEYNSQILFHTDATQAVGKISINLGTDFLDVDLLSLSAHKFHGPKGIGALFVRDAGVISPLLYGGGQQGGLRAGTENPAGVVGMIAALTTLLSASDAMQRVEQLRDLLEAGMLQIWPSAFILGASATRLPTTANLCLPGVDAEEFVDSMAAKGIAVSAGSACSYGARKPSYVVLAHGLSYELAKNCIRISLSIESTEREIAIFLAESASLLDSIGIASNFKRESA